MSEVVAWERHSTECNIKILVDKEKKLVKTITCDRPSTKDMEDWLNALAIEVKKFGKGEVLYLHDGTGIDLKVFSNDQFRLVQKAGELLSTYSKKTAIVYLSFVHQKSHQAAGGISLPDNIKYFTSIPEAMKWLQAG